MDASAPAWIEHLPPVLRTLLLSDGTVTKFLEAYYLEPVRVQTLQHTETPLDHDLAQLESRKGDPILRRRVKMVGATTERIYGLAESFLRADILWPEVRGDLVEGRLGIGELMRERRVETHRELLGCEPAQAGPWAADLGCLADAATAVRTYRIFVGGRPCLFITDRYVIDQFG